MPEETNDHRAMLAAIVADPNDDTLRLAYADWLEEQPGERVPCPSSRCKAGVLVDRGNGRYCTDVEVILCPACDGTGTVRDERRSRRAEMIRCQIAESRYIDLSLEPARSLRKRADELLAAHGAEWALVACPTCKGRGNEVGTKLKGGWVRSGTHCPECAGTGNAMHNRNPQWSRGFVAQVECGTMAEVGGEVECPNRCQRGMASARDRGTRVYYQQAGPDSGWVRCEACRDGRVFRPAVWLAAVCRAHPIQRVVVRGAEPIANEGQTFARWWRAPMAGVQSQTPWVLPRWAFDALPHDTADVVRDNHMDYPTADAARDTLYRAIADVVRAWVRREEGGGS